MVYPTTYDEMGAWVSTRNFAKHFTLSTDQVEEIYEQLRTHGLERVTGTAGGTITIRYRDGRLSRFQVPSQLDQSMYDFLIVTEAGLEIVYSASYLAAQRSSASSSSDWGGSSNNNNNNNNNN